MLGEGGVCDIEVPLFRWGDRVWFRIALAVVSLNQHFLERIIMKPQGKHQGFDDEMYTGKEPFINYDLGAGIGK